MSDDKPLVEPVETEPVETEPVETEPVETEPVQTPPAPMWLPGAAGIAVVVQLLGLYLPGSPDAGFVLPGADKIAHFLIFAVPVWLLGRLTGRVWLVAGVFAAHAVVSELVQWAFVPYREGSWGDLAADLAGIALAVALLLWRRNRIGR